MIVISRSSWHYRFMKFLGIEARYSDNLCGYLRGLLLWSPLWLVCIAFVAVVMLAIAVGLPWAIGDFIGWIAACLVNWQFIAMRPDDPAVVGSAITIVAAIAGPLVYFLERGTKFEPPALVGAAWDSIHGRICANIEVKG